MVSIVRSLGFGCLIATGLVAAALAHSGATGIVKERMDHMKAIGDATKAIGQMVQGKAAWDAGAVRARARAIAAAGGAAMTGLFPEGSIKGPSEARPEIWRDWDRFTEIAEDLQARAAALAEGAGNPRDGGPASPDQLFAAVAQTCKTCHQDFRIKK